MKLHSSILHINAKNLSESTIKIINKMVEKANEMKLKKEIIKKHLENWSYPALLSIESYASSKKISGSLLIAIKEMMDEYSAHLITENARLREAELKWISCEQSLPKNYKLGMSKEVLTIAGSKMAVKSYDWELGRWSGSPHITITHWAEIPTKP